ncbi:hypothetical protein H6G14_27800 [Nostoc parmelioides FACHB-3921]|uniref:Uncharacterized protein n=2 Tax=Nostoc TaxID=1177 RepID=A0ABR8BLQ6_9NOSO|nr:hypothetical protein [Nostoc parmelioides FACHB-3921]
MEIKSYCENIEMASIMTEETNNQKFNTDDLPQEITESYGTGVKEPPGYNIGIGHEYTETSPEFDLGDGDENNYWADTVGDEAVGGTAPTPEQDITEEIEAAVGLEMPDQASLRTNEILEQRDDRRWELDPTSSEDYEDRG